MVVGTLPNRIHTTQQIIMCLISANILRCRAGLISLTLLTHITNLVVIIYIFRAQQINIVITFAVRWGLATSRIHYSDVIISTTASQITSLAVVYSTVYSGADQRKHQSSASMAFVMWIHLWPVNSPHEGPVTRKMLPSDDVIMYYPVTRSSLLS